VEVKDAYGATQRNMRDTLNIQLPNVSVIEPAGRKAAFWQTPVAIVPEAESEKSSSSDDGGHQAAVVVGRVGRSYFPTAFQSSALVCGVAEACTFM
jgi:hypothetical protein